MTFIIDGTAGATFPNGTNPQAAPSKVLQVVNASYSTPTSTSTNTFVTTGLSATITPLFSTSKILVICNINGMYRASGATTNIATRIVRGSTAIISVDDLITYTATGSQTAGSVGISYLDSPATTSSTTYTVQFAADPTGTSVTVQNYNNLTNGSSSTLTLMEIAQ